MAAHERTRIVVWDGRGPAGGGWAEGEVIQEDLKTRKDFQEERAFALPVDQELLGQDPVAGYFRRSWGRGARFGRDAARACPMLLWAHPDYPFLHWMAHVRGERPTGRLRLSTATIASGGFVGGLAATAEAVDLPALRSRPELPGGGWIVGGVVGVSCATSGYLSLCLLGVAAEGVAVTWSAVTQASRSA